MRSRLVAKILAEKGKPVMGRELTNIPFEQWVTYVFDHPVGGPDASLWHLDDDDESEWWNASRQPEVTVAYLTNLFENAASVLAPFSDAQVKEGLWFLLDSGYSAAMFELLNRGVALSERTRCISSIYTLFERFFAPRCASHLSHLDRAGKSTDEHPLNDVCYMWWDIAPVCGCSQGLDRAELDAACLEVMRMTLDLDSDACRESALHGLGHCYFEHPTQVKAIIDRFLDHHPDLRAELRAYAWAARAGRVQ